MAMLTVEKLNVYYGMIHALKDVSFQVKEGEIVALIGANGAGKTTTLQTVSGMLPSKSGSIRFEDHDITRMPSHRIVQLGISHVPEGRRMFSDLTVYENLRMGAYTRKNKSEIDATLSMVYERFPRLKERARQLAGTLSGGEQQMLAMGRALMSNPRLLLMDEPSMGLSPLLVSEIFDIIQQISNQGVTILLVEQNAKKALSIADRAYVLETGSIVMEDDAQALLNNEAIKKAYLGE
jgi:branched-chain amino acid transport system ATP-binding protein